MDKKLWNKLYYYISKYINEDPSKVKLLDIGTGSGRDLMYANKLGYNVIGIDNSDGFMTQLLKLQNDGFIQANSFKKCDMRNLVFEDNSFDVIRNYASLLHLPLIAKGYTADLAISECYRSLRKNGLLFLLVKEGLGLKYLDTNDGFGKSLRKIFRLHYKVLICIS